MDVVLRFLAALALAHLLQCSRDTNALHPVFSDRANAGSFFLQCSRDWIQPFSADLRKILTGSAGGGSQGRGKSSPTAKWPLAKCCSHVRMNVSSKM
jgi:hypothetical protein